MRSGRLIRELLVAMAAIAVGIGARAGVFGLVGTRIPYMTFFPAIIAAALFGGPLAAVVTTVVFGLFVVGLSGNGGMFRLQSREEYIGLSLYFVTSAILLVLVETLNRSRAALARSRQDAVRAEEATRAILDSITDGFVAIGPDWRYTYANPQGEAMSGKARGSLVGKVIWSEFPQMVGTPIEAALRRAMADRVQVELETDDRPENVWFSLSIYPAANGGLSVYFRDVTAKKLAEKERRALLIAEQAARADAERASRLKDDFLATLSHELRTPLNAILGWSQVLSAATPDAKELSDGLEVITRNARIQAELVEDLLDMSRIMAGTMRLNVQQINPSAVIQAAADTVRPAAQAKQIRLELILDASAGPITGDAARLQQVVWNLLSNAIKFTPKEGHVRVELKRVSSSVEITIADSGEGIDPTFLPHIFERFRQADSSTTRRHGGLGLGLSIVKQLAEMHAGTVTAASDGVGRGATFTLRLPVAPVLKPNQMEDGRAYATQSAEVLAGTAHPDLNGLTVVAVDDDADSLSLIGRVLQECGATVLAAGSAIDAERLIAAGHPDVLVSDIGMPDVDGYEFIRRVKASISGNGRRLPAIALTAFARTEDRTRAMLAGFQMHLSKPVTPQELTAAVASLAGRT